ncbi:MAG: hypothetical protein ABI675_21585 [Chitinophagaceae bacterium]
MLLLTIEVTDRHAMKTLHSLQEKHLIKIAGDADINSPALPGSPLSLSAFKNWIAAAESMPSVSLKDAKTKWAAKRKKLLHLSK